MKLLLANLDLYEDWLARGVAQRQAFDESAYENARTRDSNEYLTAGSDAVLQLSGPLSYRYDAWSWLFGGSSYQGLAAQINAANANSEVERIVLVIDTPGGEVTGLPETARLIKDSPKPIVAVVDPCCASAGVWLASQASRIVCIESGAIGSLGVQCVAHSRAEYLKKAGIDVKIFRAAISPDKNLAHPFEPLDEKAIAYLQDRVDRKGRQFVAAVAAGRGVSEATVLAKFGQGRMLEAQEAVDVGFIDEIGSLASVLSETGSKQQTPSQRRPNRRSARLQALSARR